MSSNARVEQMKRVQAEGLELFAAKNADYGDAFAEYGPVGVMVRIGDKMRRFQNIKKTGVALVGGEGLRDTLIDLHNYAAMAIMLMDEPAEPAVTDAGKATALHAASHATASHATAPHAAAPHAAAPHAAAPHAAAPHAAAPHASKAGRVTLHFDGACRGNPGPGGAGFIIRDEAGELKEQGSVGLCPPRTTNNRAEYAALIHGLKACVAQGCQHVDAYGDSKLVIQQVSGGWKTKCSELVKLRDEAAALVKTIGDVTLSHVPRAQNKEADFLANQALDQHQQ